MLLTRFLHKICFQILGCTFLKEHHECLAMDPSHSEQLLCSHPTFNWLCLFRLHTNISSATQFLSFTKSSETKICAKYQNSSCVMLDYQIAKPRTMSILSQKLKGSSEILKPFIWEELASTCIFSPLQKTLHQFNEDNIREQADAFQWARELLANESF